MLEVRGLSAAYGQHRALEEVSLRVGKGEIVVILGANGAGKSTLLKAVSGICEGRVTGSVTVDGAELIGMPPHRIVEEGVALVPEGRGVFGELSVEENLTLGAYGARARAEERGNLDRLMALFPRLGERRRQTVRTMSGGEQQMVAIGRAMMSSPAILTLDEPSLGLSPLLSKELFANLARVRATGLGILLVEQNARASLAIADRGYLLENGRIVHEDGAKALMDDPSVQRAYLGGGGAAARTHRAGAKPAAPAAPRPAAPNTAAPNTAAPRPSVEAPTDIAAAALRAVGERSRPAPTAPAAPPPPRPEPVRASPPPLSTPRSPVPSPSSGPAAPSASTVPAGIDTAALVAAAADASSRRTGVSGGPTLPRPNCGAPAAPAAQRTPMPDLDASGADRLRAVLDEIERAAARARAYRPPPKP